MNNQLKTIKIGSKPSISVDYLGEGEMIVFLHGIGGNKKNWEENVEFFSSKFLSVAWDTRGYGESDDYLGSLNFQDVLDDLKKVLKYFNKDKAHIVGLSMGGQIATLFYEKFPESVKSLILCDTHFGLSNLSLQEIEKFINLRKEPLVQGKEPIDIAPIVAKTLIGDVNNKIAYDKLVKSISILHKNSYLKTIEASMKTEHRHVFETINIPTLILVGELDTLTPPSMAKEIKKKIPNSLIKVIPNAGHLINIEQPKLFNNYLLSFLKSLKK
ncbi:alpha/beta hydrolase [Alphaproteobacteria bacterium]|nr:alpha/beta hydrolase [Alphaproteobacteria bacterium]|tara:strand:+ start:1340 stop:2152 length:813 start_codon:yes stop_codon:yes gene_type:complete